MHMIFQKLPGEQTDVDTRELQKLNGNGYENTKFCTRFGSNYNPKFNEAENPEDECCKLHQQCDYNLPFGNYRQVKQKNALQFHEILKK